MEYIIADAWKMKMNNKPSWTCVNSSFKIISISIILKVEFVGDDCGLLLASLVGSMAELALIIH